MTDWQEWQGGECPVDPEALVDVRFDVGGVETDHAKCWDWSHIGAVDIVAYRLAPETAIEPVFGQHGWFKILPSVRSLNHLAEHAGEKAAVFVAECFRAHLQDAGEGLDNEDMFRVVLGFIRRRDIEAFVRIHEGDPEVSFSFDPASDPQASEAFH